MEKEPIVTSPITGSTEVTLIAKVSVDQICKQYQKAYGMDVSSYFHSLEEFSIYECTASKYRFYYPFDLDGDTAFYEELQQFPWYYMPWKWEHEASLPFIKQSDSILEIGCAHGAFIEHLSRKGIKATGLELNEDAVRKASLKGLDIRQEFIQDHVKSNKEYDVVCSYQVMEHIASLKEVLEASIEGLKSGGKLIISVPNNGSYLKEMKLAPLNHPPHHMGLWTTEFCELLPNFLPIRLEKLLLEPLADYHVPSFYHMMVQHWQEKYGIIGKIAVKLMRPLLTPGIHKLRSGIMGHSIMAVYVKQ